MYSAKVYVLEIETAVEQEYAMYAQIRRQER